MVTRTLNGAYVRESRLVAYCKLHKVSLTVKDMERRECIKKRCRHFDRYKNHPYWHEYEQKLEQKRLRKREARERKKLFWRSLNETHEINS